MSEQRNLPQETSIFERSLPTYQRYDAMDLVREAARKIAESGDRVIYRDAFRWKDDATGHVLSNHYEMFNLPGLAEDFGFTVIHDFCHVGVIRDRK